MSDVTTEMQLIDIIKELVEFNIRQVIAGQERHSRLLDSVISHTPVLLAWLNKGTSEASAAILADSLIGLIESLSADQRKGIDELLTAEQKVQLLRLLNKARTWQTGTASAAAPK